MQKLTSLFLIIGAVLAGPAKGAIQQTPWTTNTSASAARAGLGVPGLTADNVFTGSNNIAGNFIGNGIGLTNATATNGLLNMSSGSGDEFGDMAAGVATFAGQLGSTYAGTEDALWAANAAGSGSNAWRRSFSFYTGINQVGDSRRMPSTHLNTMNWYVNGSAANATRAVAVNGTRNGSYFFWNNVNPFTDGAGFSVPHYTTNVVGSPVLTNADGIKIYVKNQFGNQLLTIPEEYFVGETNQAGSYVWLTQPDLPTYVSQNMPLPAEAGGFYSQHYLIGIDSRGASGSSDVLNLGIHFPIQVPYCWTFTNVLNRDALFIDERFGNLYAGSNVTVAAALMATNSGHGVQHVIGPNFKDVTRPQVGLFLTTNVLFGAQDPCIVAFDNAVDPNARLGFVKQAGQYPKMAFGSSAPFIVGHSSQANLFDSNGGTLLPSLQISSTDQSLTESSATTVINITLGAGKSLSARVFATTRADDATNFQEDGDTFVVAAVNKGGTVTTSISTPVNTSAVSSGTLTTTWTAAANGNSVDIKCNAVSSLTQTTLKTKFRVDLDSTDTSSAITPAN